MSATPGTRHTRHSIHHNTLNRTRDAAHVPYIWMRHYEDVTPGTPFALVEVSGAQPGETPILRAATHDRRHGIADPFTGQGVIPAGTLFMFMLDHVYVHNVRHEFDLHNLPDISSESPLAHAPATDDSEDSEDYDICCPEEEDMCCPNEGW